MRSVEALTAYISLRRKDQSVSKVLVDIERV